MISRELSLWIAQSESWQTFIDFNLPEDSIARYRFLSRPDDFYISLFGEMYDILEDDKRTKDDILAVAKGLEIFSLKNKGNKFIGVNQPNNILFAAGLYYLSDYSASSYILANLFNEDQFEREIDKFVLSFFQRKINDQNMYGQLFSQYMATGDLEILRKLQKIIKEQKDAVYHHRPFEFSVCLLADSILSKFAGNNVWADLLNYNSKEHWQAYIDKCIAKSFPVWDFFPSQQSAIERGLLNSFQSIALQTPTSSGKTAICELLIYNEYINDPNSKILYLAPFRALAAELKQSFGINLARLGISSKTIYGGNIPTGGEKELIQNVSLLISTPEKFMAIENTIPNFLNSFTMIICDEGHLLNDKNRGLSYELLLSRLKDQEGIKRKFVFISAIIPNIQQINEWLGGNAETVVRSTYRATEIEYGFLRAFDSTNNNYLLDVNPFKPIPQNYKLNKFLTRQDFVYQRESVEEVYRFSSFKVKSVAVARKALNSGSVALFTPAKGGKTGVAALAMELISQIKTGLNLPNPVNYLKDGGKVKDYLKEYFAVIFGDKYLLCQLIEYGAVFHHGDLPQYVREAIEDAIRKEEIKFVICTNTIAEGVNLPIRTIVINSARRFEDGWLQPLKLRDLKNLVGRAGRAGKETKGLIIVPNPADFDIIQQVIEGKNLEDVHGRLYDIVNEIVEKIAGRLTLTNEMLEEMDEEFQELVDAIDISIIDLLGEEIQAEELQETIQTLINKTFAKFQSNETEAETLNNIINLRGENLKPFIERKEFKYIKQSGATVRAYAEISVNLDTGNQLWRELNNPADENWFKFLIDEKIGELPSIKFQLLEFNKKYKCALTIDIVKSAIKLWIQGSWFETISELCDSNIDAALVLINSFIGYHIQSMATSIIRNVEMRLEEEGQRISSTVLNFPQYLLYGLNSQLQIDLIEMGFNDRIGILALSSLPELAELPYSNILELKLFLRDNRRDLLLALKDSIPHISYLKLFDAFRFIRIPNIN